MQKKLTQIYDCSKCKLENDFANDKKAEFYRRKKLQLDGCKIRSNARGNMNKKRKFESSFENYFEYYFDKKLIN